MGEYPKRRKHKDNPYTIEIEKSDYIVNFIDITGVLEKVKVTKEIYTVFNEFELQDKKEMNEFDRHIEHSEIYENNLEKRTKQETSSIEDDFIKKVTFEELKRAIEMLPITQKRRIKKYYFEDKNEYQIAKEENVKQSSICENLELAIKNLREILKKFIN